MLPQQIYTETLRIHPNTREDAYIARRGRYQYVMHNERVSIGYDMVWFESLHFTPDGSALFYLAERVNETAFVVNGVEERVFETVLDTSPFQRAADGTARGLHVVAVVQGTLQVFDVLPSHYREPDTIFG